MHKNTHTAVIINCWSRRLGSITFSNRPGAFDKFVSDVKKLCGELRLAFGLEDTHGFGRSLAVYLAGHKYTVKHVNPAYTLSMRNSAPMSQKDDDYDSFCVAKALRDMIDKLPDAVNEDIFWTIRQLVKRRDAVTKAVVSSKNQLHEYVSFNFPSYQKFFSEIDGKSAMYFWEHYPSAEILQATTPEELTRELKTVNKGFTIKKAEQIFQLIEDEGYTKADYQHERDFIIKSIVRDLNSRFEEQSLIDEELKRIIPLTGYKLQTMSGISIVTESQIIAEIGDIRRFPNADKLSRFAGIAPINFSSAGKGKDLRCRQGNRNLNKIFHFLAIQLIQVNKDGTARHPAFRRYFEKKLSENKTKPQALMCVSKRALKIIYGMMRTKSEYRPFEE
jgi:transposase